MTDSIKLIKGNCFELNDDIGDESIDLIVTDPPYGMSFVSNMRKVKYKPIANDNNLEWLSDWFKSQFRILKNDSHAYVFCSWHRIDVFKKEAESAGFIIKNILIWFKNNAGQGDLLGDYAPQHEFILFLSKGRRLLNGKRISNVIRCPKTGNENHPTEKPVKLIQLMIEKSSNQGDTVLDNFFGSGSCAQACYNLNRKFVGHEIDEERFNDANKRVKILLSQTKLF